MNRITVSATDLPGYYKAHDSDGIECGTIDVHIGCGYEMAPIIHGEVLANRLNETTEFLKALGDTSLNEEIVDFLVNNLSDEIEKNEQLLQRVRRSPNEG